MSDAPLRSHRSAALLRGTAIANFAFAAALLALEASSLVARGAAIICIFTGVATWRRANGSVSGREGTVAASARLKWHHWATSGALACLWALSYYWLYRDARDGYNDIAPVITFAALGLVSSVWFGIVIARLLGNRL
jgi:hypothetical protein